MKNVYVMGCEEDVIMASCYKSCLFLWRHLENISALLLRRCFLSAFIIHSYIYIYTRVIGVDGLVTGSSLTIVLKIGSKSVYDISGSNCPYLSYDEGAAGWPAAPLM